MVSPLNTLKLYIKDFLRYRYLLYNLISRDFKLKYRRSVLGVAWSVLNPLLMCGVMVVVFGSLFIFTLLGLLVKLIGDLTYTLVDPRIDFASREQ